MFAVDHLAEVPELLTQVFSERIEAPNVNEPETEVRGAVGLFLVRDDGANGSKLAKEIVASFQYWKARSGHYFDGIFLGWGYDAVPAYLGHGFANCVKELEEMLDWRYSGGAHLFLLDFVYDPRRRQGYLDFSSGVPLDLSGLLEEKKYVQLAPLIEEIIRPLVEAPFADGRSPTWRVSDYIAVLRARRLFWQAFVKKLGVLMGVADDVAKFAVRDLRRQV